MSTVATGMRVMLVYQNMQVEVGTSTSPAASPQRRCTPIS